MALAVAGTARFTLAGRDRLVGKKVPVIQERLRGRWRPVDAKDHAYIEAVILEQFEDVGGDAGADGLTSTDALPQWADEAPSLRQKRL